MITPTVRPYGRDVIGRIISLVNPQFLLHEPLEKQLMKHIDRKGFLLFFVSPKLKLIKILLDAFKSLYRNRKKRKMQLPVKLAIGSISAFFFIIIVGFVFFPRMLHSKVRGVRQISNNIVWNFKFDRYSLIFVELWE